MTRRFLTPGWLFGHVLVVAAVLLCLRLAWWQLARSHESDGGFQNLGYALLWPLFGAAFIYMWVKFLKLESIRDQEIEAEHAQSLSSVLAEAEELTASAARTSRTPQEENPVPQQTQVSQRPEPSVVFQPSEHLSDETEELPFGVGIVGDEDQDDPELVAYNRALAALAEQDHRRAR